MELLYYRSWKLVYKWTPRTSVLMGQDQLNQMGPLGQQSKVGDSGN